MYNFRFEWLTAVLSGSEAIARALNESTFKTWLQMDIHNNTQNADQLKVWRLISFSENIFSQGSVPTSTKLMAKPYGVY